MREKLQKLTRREIIIIAAMIFVIAAVLVLGLTAGSKTSGIDAFKDDYMEQHAGEIKLGEALSSSDLKISTEGNSTIVFSVYHNDVLDGAAIAHEKDTYSTEEYKDYMNNLFAGMKDEIYKIKNPKLIHRIYNGDSKKTLILEQSYDIT